MPLNNPEIPYNDLPDLPPKAELETLPVLKKAIAANVELAELKGYCEKLPDPAILLNTIVMQESKDSSAIENIVTTQDQLYKAVLNPTENYPFEVKEVLSYREAMYAGIRELERTNLITSNLAVRIMQTMKRTTAGLRNTPGVKLVNPNSQRIIYTPPDHQLVPDKLKNWETFVNAPSDLDPLVRMAVMHYHFEAIHPFADGNGRTGRILNVLFLVKEGRLNLPVLYHSAYIIQHKAGYYRCLREVSEDGNWQQWVLYMLEAIEETARNTLNLVKSIVKLKDEMLRIIQAHPHKMPAHDLAELLFTYPYIKSKTLMEKGLGTRPTVSRYLGDLEQAGLLDILRMGREIYFVNFNLLNLLSARMKM